MGLFDVFNAGGWPMYPILIVGIYLVVATVRQVKRGEPRELPLVRNLRQVTLLTGFLGTTLGMIHCLMGIGGLQPDQPYGKLALIGLGESLNCISLSLIVIITAALITTFGALRSGNAD